MANICKIAACILFSVWICSASVMAFLAWESCSSFCIHHLGVVFVLFGVIGETIWEERKKLKHFFGWLLIAGLLLEMREAVNEDNKIEVLRQKNNELEAKMRWRTITPEKRKQFIDFLKGSPKTPIIVGIDDQKDDETVHYADEIKEMLNLAGFGTGKDRDLPVLINFFPAPSEETPSALDNWTTNKCDIDFVTFETNKLERNMDITVWPNFRVVTDSNFDVDMICTNGNEVSALPVLLGKVFSRIGIRNTVTFSDSTNIVAPGKYFIWVSNRF